MTACQGEGEVEGDEAEGEDVPAMRPGTAPNKGEAEVGGEVRDLMEAVVDEWPPSAGKT